MAAGSSAGRVTTCAPSAEPPWSGLTISGSPSRVDQRVQHGLRAQLAERGVRQRHPVRGVQARRGPGRPWRSACPRPAGRPARGADVRHPEQLQHRLHRAVLALAAVQRDDHGVRPVRAQPLDQRRRRRPTRRPTPGRAQRVGQPPARTAATRRARGSARRPAPPRCRSVTAVARAVTADMSRHVSRVTACPGRASAGRGRARGSRPVGPAERAHHVQLALQHPGQPAHPLGDPLRRRVAVRQPQLPAAETVGVEPGPGT